MHSFFSGSRRFALCVALVAFAGLLMGGCPDDGDDGKNGTDGAPGAPGAPGEPGTPASQLISIPGDDPETLNFNVSGITISSPMVVNFTVVDDVNRGGVGLGTSLRERNPAEMNWARFTVAKLVPGIDGNPDAWVNYLNPNRGTYERIAAGLMDHGDGTYTYTFSQDLDAYNGVTFEPSLTHRLCIQSSGGTWDAVNYVIDFVPDQLPSLVAILPNTRDVVTTAACNECHTELLNIHGTRYETKYCVACHNPGLEEGDMTMMTHAIHAGDFRETAYELGGDDFSHVVFPQDLMDCAKCHQGTDGDHWTTEPNMVSCGSCHDDVEFAGHMGGQTDNSKCAGCHQPDDIIGYHITDNPTPFNPLVPEGAINITYEIDEVTVGMDDEPVVKFRVLADGTPVVFNTYSSGDEIMIDGFTNRAPGFLVAWALPQDGIEEPADYNNLGFEDASGGQPISVALDDVWNGTDGTLMGPDGDGWYTAYLEAVTFPEGSTLRAVAMQGYFIQVEPNDDDEELSRHTISVVEWVEGEERRDIADSNKCASCHEWFEGHGGNRVFTVQACAVCHVPNLSSSGRAEAPSEGEEPLDYPEDTNNLKDMIHGIHAAADRTYPYEFVRGGSHGGYYDWSHVLFPTSTSSCLTCHIDDEDTYFPDSIPAGALVTTRRTTTGEDETAQDVKDARLALPNDTDIVHSPISSTCFYCHDSDATVAHMEQNGGAINWERGEFLDRQPIESCNVCHGEGKFADVELVHEDD